jgi:hypothetical protein
MDRDAFKIVKTAFNEAKAKLALMKRAVTPEACVSSWQDFLVAQHRVFAKLKYVTMNGPSKGWFDQITNEQRTDDLLKYLLHARDQLEHGGADVIQHRRQTTLLQWNPNQLGALAFKPIMTVPTHVRIVPVIDRNTKYLLPKTHLGNPLEKADPISIAELALKYLGSKMSEAETRFVK